MKNILLSSVALLGVTAAAFAADLPSRRMAPAPYVAAVPVFTWTGFYAGVNAGYGFGGDHNDNNSDFGTFGTSGGTFVPAGTFAASPTSAGVVSRGFGVEERRNNDGFVGGGQIGYNYQVGQVVWGFETDIQYADFGRNRDDNVFGVGGPLGVFTPTAGPNAAALGFVPNAQFSDRRNIDFFGTVRGRVGYAWNRTMLYATGGFAYGGGGNDNRNSFGTFGFRNNEDDIRTGYAVGGGLEYAFSNNWTAKIEGLYVNLERSRNDRFVGTLTPGTVLNPGATTLPVVVASNRRNDDDFAVVRVGLNYKFW